VTAEQILAYEREKPADYFQNFVAGLPYAGATNRLSQQTLFACLTDEVNRMDTRPIIGVDTGAKIHLVCGNEQGIFYYNESDDYEELEKLLTKWKNAIVVMDEGGDIIKPRQLRAKYPGRIFLCHFSQDRKTMQLIRWGEDDEAGHVIADRNRMMQLVVDEFTAGNYKLHGTTEGWDDYWLHWKNVYRTATEDALGIIKFSWERQGADHLCFATLYWRIGMDRFGAKATIINRKGSDNPLGAMPAAPQTGQELIDILKFKKSDDWRKLP